MVLVRCTRAGSHQDPRRGRFKASTKLEQTKGGHAGYLCFHYGVYPAKPHHEGSAVRQLPLNGPDAAKNLELILKILVGPLLSLLCALGMTLDMT